MALLAGQVVMLALSEGTEGSRPAAIERRAGGAELPADPSQVFPRTAPAPDRTPEPWDAPLEMADAWRFEPVAARDADPLELNTPEEAAALLEGPEPAESSEAAAVDSVPPEPKTVPRSPGGFLDALDLSLDAAPGGGETRAPSLALPEPDLVHSLSPAGTSSAE